MFHGLILHSSSRLHTNRLPVRAEINILVADSFCVPLCLFSIPLHHPADALRKYLPWPNVEEVECTEQEDVKDRRADRDDDPNIHFVGECRASPMAVETI